MLTVLFRFNGMKKFNNYVNVNNSPNSLVEVTK